MENRFAAARRRYLRTHMDGIYTGMLLTGTLEPHLAEIGESAQAKLVRGLKKLLQGLIFRLSRDLPLEGQIFPATPIKSTLPTHPLVRGYIEKWRSQEKFSPWLNFSPFS